MTPPSPRPLPDIVRDITSLRARRDELHAGALQRRWSDRGALAELALVETEVRLFDAMCTRTGPHVLMATGLLWGDELRHPLAEGVVALVRLADLVEVDGEEMTIAAATKRFASGMGRGPAIADWTHGTDRLGFALGIEHPSAAPVELGTNYSLF